MSEPLKVLTATDGAVTTVTINRPEVRNAIDHETAQLLKAAFLEFEADASQSAAVLCSIGETFCSGYDLPSSSVVDFGSTFPVPILLGCSANIASTAVPSL